MSNRISKYLSDQVFLYWTIFILFSAVLITSYFYYADPNPKISLCMFYNLTKLPCPGCGLTRSFCAMAKGQIIEAFNFHLLGPIIFTATVTAWSTSLLAICQVKKPFLFCQLLVTNDLFIKVTGCVIGVYWLLRLFSHTIS